MISDSHLEQSSLYKLSEEDWIMVQVHVHVHFQIVTLVACTRFQSDDF